MRKVGNQAGFQKLELTPLVDVCRTCGTSLWVGQHRRRPLQTLVEKYKVVARDKWCPNPQCASYRQPIRPMTEGLLRTVPKCGYGIDVIFLSGERRLKGGRSLPEIHKELETEYGVRISGRHLPNLLKVFMALVHAVNAETDVIKRIL